MLVRAAAVASLVAGRPAAMAGTPDANPIAPASSVERMSSSRRFLEGPLNSIDIVAKEGAKGERQGT